MGSNHGPNGHQPYALTNWNTNPQCPVRLNGFFFVEDPYFSINIKFEHAKLNPGPIDENHGF